MPDEAIGGFDVAGATAAIEAGGGLTNMMAEEGGHVAAPVAPEQTTAPTPQTTEQQTSATPPHWSQQQRDDFGRWQAQQTQQQQDTPEQFSQVDPNALSPELQQVYKSLQADYTRKTQAVAEQRRQYEQYGDPDTLRQATELYSALQDPNNWPAIHQELTQNLQAMGLSPLEAQAEASRQMGETQQQTGTNPEWSDDPELAPVKDYVQQLEQRLSKFEGEWQARQQQEQQERLQTALVGELQRQENLIRQNNPTYTDHDVDAVYELSSYYGGNLLQAQQRYEQLWADRLGRYMDGKGQAVAAGGVSLPGASTTTQEVKPDVPARDFDGAHAGVMEALRSIDAL